MLKTESIAIQSLRPFRSYSIIEMILGMSCEVAVWALCICGDVLYPSCDLSLGRVCVASRSPPCPLSRLPKLTILAWGAPTPGDRFGPICLSVNRDFWPAKVQDKTHSSACDFRRVVTAPAWLSGRNKRPHPTSACPPKELKYVVNKATGPLRALDAREA